jgi:hypothetical protein
VPQEGAQPGANAIKRVFSSSLSAKKLERLSPEDFQNGVMFASKAGSLPVCRAL